MQKTYLNSPGWFAAFVFVGWLIVILIGLLVRLTTGLSAASDVVFGCEAAIAGFATELLFQRLLGRRLLLLPKLEVPFAYFWLLLCIYVIVMRPFEHAGGY